MTVFKTITVGDFLVTLLSKSSPDVSRFLVVVTIFYKNRYYNYSLNVYVTFCNGFLTNRYKPDFQNRHKKSFLY